MLNSIATGFEKTILFGAGRHLWNAVGVAGIIAVTAGGISYFYSFTSAPQKVEWCEWISKRDSSFNCNKKTVTEEIGGGAKLYTPVNYNHKLYNDYLEYQSTVPNPEEDKKRKEEIRLGSILSISWGAGTVAAVSVISAILAVERNTRKD
jgi:hypothetical protein